MADVKGVIESQVLSVHEIELQLAVVENELLKSPVFRQFTDLRKQLNDKYAEVRQSVAEVMIPAYVNGDVSKSIRGEWGSITVTESDEFDADVKLLSEELKKVVPVMSKIKDYYHLTGEAPEGATFKGTKYGVMMKLHGQEDKE